MRHLLLSVNRPDLVKGLDGGGEAPVHAEDLRGRARQEGREAEAQCLSHLSHPHGALAAYLAINDGRQAEVVKDLSAVAPHGHGAVFTQALIIEAIDLCDLTALMVAPDQGDAIRIANLKVTTKLGLRSRLSLSLRHLLTSVSPSPSSSPPWPRFMPSLA